VRLGSGGSGNQSPYIKEISAALSPSKIELVRPRELADRVLQKKKFRQNETFEQTVGDDPQSDDSWVLKKMTGACRVCKKMRSGKRLMILPIDNLSKLDKKISRRLLIAFKRTSRGEGRWTGTGKESR